MPARNIILRLLMIFWLMIAIGCSASGGSDTTTDDTTTSDVTPAAVELEAANNSILLNGSTTVTATVYDSAGSPIPDVAVYFSVDNPVLARVSSPATTNGNGVATTTLTARDTPGNVTVTAAASGAEGSGESIEITITATEMPATINLTATPTTIEVQQTTTITAEVLDSNGDPIADGTSVTFNVDNTSLGELSTNSATTVNGFASTTFEADADAGTVTITAAAGDVQNDVSVSILQSAPQSLVYISATPQRIALEGTAGVTSSVVRFQVLDENSNPVNGINVALSMEGPNGGEYLNSSSISSNLEGYADVILNAGTVAGPVTITGTITTSSGPFTTASRVISIGGGVPSAKRFAVAADPWNLAGLNVFGLETEINVYLADRFGNFNILKGTTVSFATEIGLTLLSSEVTLDENGLATTTARTQGSTTNIWPEPVETNDEDRQLLDYILAKYPAWPFRGTPSDGYCSVLIYTKGEEHFDDTNANGEYDFGEPFIDTPDDPFIDYNNNGIYDGPASSDPQEIFIDSDSDGEWDDKNGVWDSDKTIFTNINIKLTGDPPSIEPCFLSNPTSFYVLNGGGAAVTFLICDEHLLPLEGGTTITFSVDGAGTLRGKTTWTLPTDGTSTQIEYSVQIADDNTDEIDPPASSTIELKVNWRGTEYYASVSGSVD